MNTTAIAHSTGRQRGDGRWPSGNSRTMMNSRSTVATAPTEARHPTALAAGRAPGAVATPYSAYCSANMLVATDRPIEPSSQPMALSGWRLVIRWPLAAYSSTAADRTALSPTRAVPIRLVFSIVNTSAATSTARIPMVRNRAAVQVRFAPVVVLGLAAVGVQADLVVVVEVAAVGGVPGGDGPAAFGRRGGELVVRGAGGQHERGVPGGDVHEHARGELVDRGRAARAGLVPVRAEHHVLHDQLPLVPEQLGQRDRAVRALEDVLLVHLDHGQPAPVGVERVVGAGELLLARQQTAPGLQPLLPGDDIGKTHRETSCE